MIDNKLVKKFLVGATVVTGIVASNVVASSPLHHADTSNIAEASEVTGNFKIETIVQGDKVITGQGPAGAEVTIYLNVDGYEYKLANRPIVNEDGLWESGDIGPWLSEAGNSIRAEVNIDGTISDDRMTILANGEEEVARLFADETDTQLTEGIKQVDIDEAKMLVDALPDRESKETLLNRIKIAQNLLDIKEVEMQAEAKEAVDHLFSDETETSVQSGVNEGTIEAAKQLVEALPEGTEKTALLERIAKAEDLLNRQKEWEAKQAEAKEAVDHLFSDETETSVQSGVNEGTIEAAKQLVEALPEGTEKTALLERIAKAEDLLNRQKEWEAKQAEAKEAVDHLFSDETETSVQSGVNEGTIEAAKQLVEALPEGTEKTALLERIAKAEDLLNRQKEWEAKQAEAKEAVDHLFSDETETSVQSGVNEGTIEAAKQLVEALPEGNEKTALLERIEKAEDLLNRQKEWEAKQAEAKEAVDHLFSDKTETSVQSGVNEGTIEAAKQLVEALPEGNEKTALLERIEKAEDLLNRQKEWEAKQAEAKEAVDHLFSDKTETSVQSGVNEGTIEAAKQLVEALPEGTEKNKVSRNPEKLRFDHSSNISPHSTQKEQADKEKLPTTGDVALISSSILGGIMTLLSAIYMRRRK